MLNYAPEIVAALMDERLHEACTERLAARAAHHGGETVPTRGLPGRVAGPRLGLGRLFGRRRTVTCTC